MTGAKFFRRLFLPQTDRWWSLLVGLFWVFALVAVSWTMLWFQKDGLKDSRGLPLSPLDVLYFTVITLTTVGYGDIVPVSEATRAIVTFGLTPMRIVIFLILFGTAYELVIKKSVETYQMEKLKIARSGHTVICGFGSRGHAAARELLARGVAASNIIVIEKDRDASELATELGLVAINGDAGSEQVLEDAVIGKASHAIIATDSDETCVLICLIIRDLAPDIHIHAAARQEANVKVIRRSGADSVIAPSVTGGRLLAGEITAPRASSVLAMLGERGRGLDLSDYDVAAEDVGKTPVELEGKIGGVVACVFSKGRGFLPLAQTRDHRIESGDVLIVLREEERDS